MKINQSSTKYQMLNKIRISILGDQALIVGTENDINDIYSIHDHVAPHCLHDMLSLCPHSDETFTFFRPGSILIMNKMILEVVSSDKLESYAINSSFIGMTIPNLTFFLLISCPYISEHCKMPRRMSVILQSTFVSTF